jgi:predicted  nucleic acid-binding Zn-ribbon protein
MPAARRKDFTEANLGDDEVTQPTLPTLKEQLKSLEHLQELDLKIDALKKQKAGLPSQLKSLEDSFGKASKAATAKRSAIEDLEKARRQAQAAIELNNDRLARASSKLESVQNSHEYNAANKEMDQLKKSNTELETQIKKLTQDIDAGNKALSGVDEELGKAQTARDSQAGAISGQESQLDSQISSLNQERGQYTTNVDKRILAQYDRVRVARGGLGIVPAVSGRCKGCNMVVPPQLYNEVQRGNHLQMCPSCNRILYAPATGQPSEGATAHP